VAFVVDRFKPVVEDCGRVQTVRPLSVENTAGIGVARSIFDRRDAAERVGHVLCAGGLAPKVNRSARNPGLATDKEGPGWLLQGGSQVVQRNDRAAFIKCESDRVDPIRQEGAEADVGPVGRATAAFLGPAPRGPAALHERLREVYGLVVRDPLWLAIAADCIDERRLKCTELFKVAVLPTQCVAEQPGEEGAAGEKVCHSLLVHDRTAEAHQRRVEAKGDEVHHAPRTLSAAQLATSARLALRAM